MLDHFKTTISEFIDEQIQVLFSMSDIVLDAFLYIALAGVLVKIFYNYRDGGSIFGFVSYIPLAFFFFFYMDILEGVFYLGSEGFYERTGDTSIFYPVEETKSNWEILSSISSKNLEIAITKGLAYIALIMADIFRVLAFLYIKATIFLRIAVLAFFGPLTIAISFIPGLEGNWIGWLMKVIEVSIYIPVLFLLEWTTDNLLANSIKPGLLHSEHAYLVDVGFFNMIVGVLFYSVMIFSYFSVPKIVNWGLATASSSFSGGIRKAASMLTRVR